MINTNIFFDFTDFQVLLAPSRLLPYSSHLNTGGGGGGGGGGDIVFTLSAKTAPYMINWGSVFSTTTTVVLCPVTDSGYLFF